MTSAQENKDLEAGGVPLYLIATQLIIGFLLILENALLLTVVYRNSDLHSTSYIFIASLGIADLMVGCLSLAGSAYYLVVFYHQPDSSEPVRSLATTVYICLAVGMSMLSCVHMAVVSLERYFYIVRPFLYQKHASGGGLIRNLICAIWIFSAIYIAGLCLAQTQINYISVLYECDSTLKYSAIASVYAVSTSVTGVSYVRILRVVRHQRRAILSVEAVNGNAVKLFTNARSLKFFIYVFGLYLITTLPAMFDMLFHEQVKIPPRIRFVLVPFILLNSVTNFGVLVAVDKKFRGVLVRQFKY